MYYAGIDIAKRKHEATVVDAAGKQLSKSISFANSKEGCDKLLDLFESFNITTDDVIIGMEATGHYWYSLYSYLLEKGYSIEVINPIQSNAFRRMSIRKTKNDAKDSLVIAQLMRFGDYASSRLCEEGVQALKMLSRYRSSIVDECSDCKRKVISLLDQVFPEYEKLFSDIFGSASKEVLLHYPTPEDMLAIPAKKLTALLNKASNGRFKDEKTQQLKEVASTSFGVSFAKDAFSFQIKQLIEQIFFLEKQLNELEKKISSMLSQTNSFITTIPGIGDILGAAIISEIGDVNRFGAPSKLVAFAGLDATVSQSGEFSSSGGHMSKRGSPYLRRAIWIAARQAAFCDPTLSDYYQSLRKRGKHHLTAVAAVARKMCNIIFAILKENRPYQPLPPKRLTE